MFETALSHQLSAISFHPLFAVGGDGATLVDKAVTFGMIFIILEALSSVAIIWASFRPQRSVDDKILQALSGCSGRHISEQQRWEKVVGEQIAALVKATDAMKDEGTRRTEDIWRAMDRQKEIVQSLSSDLSRALGRLEGRADVMDALRAALPKQPAAGDKTHAI